MPEYPTYYTNPHLQREDTECMYWNWDRGGAGWSWCGRTRQTEPGAIYCGFHQRLKDEGKF